MNYKVLCAALAVVALLVVTDARKTTGTRSRGGSSGSRGTSRAKNSPSAPPAPSSGGFSQQRPSSGHTAPKAAEHRPVGWQVNNKETAVRKDVAATQHAGYPAASNGLSGSGTAQGAHSYPSSGGLSGNSPIHQQSPVQKSHSQPPNAQPDYALSYAPNNKQSPTYPNSAGGLSGHTGSAPPGHLSPSGGASYPGQQGTHQGAYPAQQGIHQSAPPPYPGGATANNHPSGYPGQAAYPINNQQSATYPNSGGLSGHPGSAPSGYPSQSGGGSYPGQQGTHQSAYPGQPGIHQSAPPAYPGGATGVAYPIHNVGHANYPQAPVYPGYGGGGYGSPGSFGGYNAYGNKGSSALTGLGIAGAGAGTLLTGLALWNLARSTSGGSRHSTQQHNVYNTYNTYNETHIGPGAARPADPNAPAIDPVLGMLVNCTLTISATNATEVLAIPCAIATSVASANHEKLPEGSGTDTKCIVTVVNTNGTEFMTTIACSQLTDLAAKAESFPQPTSNCTLPAGLTPDPINPCMPLDGDVTVVPLPGVPDGSTVPPPALALDSSPAPTTAPAA